MAGIRRLERWPRFFFSGVVEAEPALGRRGVGKSATGGSRADQGVCPTG